MEQVNSLKVNIKTKVKKDIYLKTILSSTHNNLMSYVCMTFRSIVCRWRSCRCHWGGRVMQSIQSKQQFLLYPQKLVYPGSRSAYI